MGVDLFQWRLGWLIVWPLLVDRLTEGSTFSKLWYGGLSFIEV
jgi:hypothetical protein